MHFAAIAIYDELFLIVFITSRDIPTGSMHSLVFPPKFFFEFFIGIYVTVISYMRIDLKQRGVEQKEKNWKSENQWGK